MGQPPINDLIVAHQQTVKEWYNERPDDYRKLRRFAAIHTDDALYWPMSTQIDLEDEFYAEIRERAGVAPPYHRGHETNTTDSP